MWFPWVGVAQFHTFDQFALLYLFRIEYEDQQDRLLKAMQQNVGPHTQMVSDTIRPSDIPTACVGI